MNLDFNKICRLCLQFCEEYIDLSQTNDIKNLSAEITEKIKFCYFIQIDSSEGLPTKVCYQCVQVLTLFNVTKRNAMASEQMLRNILYIKKKSESTEVSNLEDNDINNSSDVAQSDNQPKKNKHAQIKKYKKLHKPNKRKLKKVSLKSAKKYINKFYKTRFSSKIIYKNKLSYHKHNKSKRGSCNKRNDNELLLNHTKRNLPRSKLESKQLQVNGNKERVVNKLKKNVNKSLDSETQSLRDLKKLNGGSFKESQKPCEVAETFVQNIPGKEKKPVKEIGTVIDRSNILSPDVKRTRKSLRL